MAESDDIKPTQPIYPSRRIDRRQRPKLPPEEKQEHEQATGKRRPGGGHKGQNVDDYA